MADNEIKGGSGSKRQRVQSLNESTTEQNQADPIKGSTGQDPKAPASVEETPNAKGLLPSDERVATQNQADSSLDQDNIATMSYTDEDGNDVTLTIDDVNTVWRENHPHYFEEQKDQAFYHEMIVYIQGADVSPWLQGQLRINNRLNSNPNQCTFTLNNAGNRFMLTTENLRGEFRVAPGADYDESIKKQIFDFKADINNNPLDPASGGRRWPLTHWGLVFHKYDPVRVWIRNPTAPADDRIRDEWLPVFTGYIISKTKSENFIDGNSEITVICEDIRHIMSKMRVNTNTVFSVLPGEIYSGNAGSDYLAKQYPNPVNKHLDKSFFRDLTVRSNYDNPWVNLTLRELVQALTFSKNAQAIVTNSESRYKTKLTQRLKDLKEELDIARQTGADQSTISDIERDYTTVKQEYISMLDYSGNTTSYYNQASTTQIGYNPGTSKAGTVVTLKQEDLKASGRNSSLGAIQQGIFPILIGQENTTIPSSNTKDEADNRRAFLQDWHSTVSFGQPNRDNVSTEFSDTSGAVNTTNNYGARNGTLNFPGPRRYWTESEVRSAGRLTKTDHAWRPDAQAVHMMEPGANTAGAAIFQELKIVQGANAATNRQWTNRLDILVQACTVVDYRFYVSGTGDLIFEPPMYDFSPRDFGTWENIFSYDYHVQHESLDEERNEITTVVVAIGTITGRRDVSEEQSLTDFGAIPHAVIWSPTLVSRLGMQIEVITFPRIIDNKRLQQLASLHFQKKIGLADTYDMTTVYRPWSAINRPVYNKYRTRFALVDEVANTLPVTNNQGEPQTQLSLSYTRPLDEAGIPRYITGGASQAVFFGETANNASIAELIAKRAQSLRDAIGKLQRDRSKLTTQELRKIREAFNGFLPIGQDIYNVIKVVNAESEAADTIGSTEEDILQDLDDSLAIYDQYKSNNTIIDASNPKELDAILASVDEAIAKLKTYGVNVESKSGEVNYGKSGIYSTEMDVDTDEDDNAIEPAAQPTKPERGAQGFVLEWGNLSQGTITYPITREDRATIISYLTWQGIPEDLVLWTWLQAFALQYPTEQSLATFIATKQARSTNPVPSAPSVPQGNSCIGCFGYVRSRYPNGSPKHRHQGVDIGDTADVPIIAALSGEVTHASEVWETGFSGYGKHVAIKCDEKDDLWCLYAHMNSVAVNVGDHVYKGQQLGTVGATGFYRTREINGESVTVPVEERTDDTRSGIPHLHWETATHAYPQPGGEVNRISPVDFLEPTIDEDMAPDAIITIVNGVLDGSIPSKNTKATIYKAGSIIERRISKITGRRLKGSDAAAAYAARYKQVGSPISIDEGFTRDVNWFFENSEGIEIPITAYRQES